MPVRLGRGQLTLWDCPSSQNVTVLGCEIFFDGLGFSDFGFHAALHPCLLWVHCLWILYNRLLDNLLAKSMVDFCCK
jgi:hypothetical protein